jgi:hypothetical protein
MLPSTTARVPQSTDPDVNAAIRQKTLENISNYAYGDKAAIETRLKELDAEWDIERTLEVNASSVALVGLILAATVDRRWIALPMTVCGFLLVHGTEGWCPPLPLFRRMGIRTASEIDRERYALKALRGDFKPQPEHGTFDAREALMAVEK